MFIFPGWLTLQDGSQAVFCDRKDLNKEALRRCFQMESPAPAEPVLYTIGHSTRALPAALKAAGIGFRHAADLGGLRRARVDSINSGWRNASFRGYADYMQTEKFEPAVEKLSQEAAAGLTVIMCAEAVPWRCHRSLVADALTVRSIRVAHITGPGRALPHVMTSFARVEGMKITYPA
jgi:uncharacterized protein (DUF488 family)